ncbi:MAG: hypothetical protein LC132_11615 [Burkholderiales bacterium]|jgi:hypothetical protein|nr:hypothetical protein [Burkholderiales bacterium]
MANVQQKQLEGLKFRTSERKEVAGDDGAKKIKLIPVVRPLVLDDILSQRDDGDSFHVVTKDGKKYDIPKNPAKEPAKEG